MAGRRNHYGEGFSRGQMSTSRTMAALREMGEHVVEAAKDALKQGADMVVADAKSRCPVKTGALRDSIQAVPNKDGTVYEISANARNVDQYFRVYYYGARVEFDPKINKPFMYPAMDANRNAIYSNVKDAISDAIRRGS